MMQQLIMDSFIPDEEKTQITNMEELIDALDEGIFITTYINDIHLDYDEYKIADNAIVFSKNGSITAKVEIDKIRCIQVCKISSTGEAE